MELSNSGLYLPNSYINAELQRLSKQDRELKRMYEAASNSQFRPVVSNNASGDAVMNNAGTKLRQLSRHLEENHDIVVSVFDDLLNNIVGAGANVTPMVRSTDGTLNDDLNKQLYDAFQDWGDYPDVTGELGFEQLERQVARHLFRDGEIFIRPIVSDRFNYRTNTRLALELVEADYCPFDANSNDGRIVHGIERNQWGAPSNYYFYKSHPGNVTTSAQTVNISDLKRVNANGVYHLKFTRRLKQARGVPLVHSVVNRLRDLKDYEESERIAAKVAADFTFAITKSSELGVGPTPVNVDGNRSLSMSAGMGFELLPGEDVKTISSDRPNSGLRDFRADMLRAVAGGTGTRYSSIAKDYNGTYSAQRQELVEGAVSYRVHFAYLVRRLYKPIWKDFIRAQILAGRININDVEPGSIFRCDFRAPALPWIDPQKEAKAWRELVDAKLESRSEIMRQRGRDPRKVIEELEKEQDEGVFASTIDAVDPTADDQDNQDEQDNKDKKSATA